MSLSSSSEVSSASSPPAFTLIAPECAFSLASQLCVRLHAAKGMAGFLYGKTLRKSSHGPSPDFAAAFEAATHFIPTSEFLTAPDILDDSAVSLVCTVFYLPRHSWYQSAQPVVDMIRATLSLPAITGSLADLFTIIAPMVPAESTALPEICDVGWRMLRPGHPDSVAGRSRQSLLIGFIIALAIKGLMDPDCLVLPAVAPGLEVRLPAPSTSARLGEKGRVPRVAIGVNPNCCHSR